MAHLKVIEQFRRTDHWSFRGKWITFIFSTQVKQHMLWTKMALICVDSLFLLFWGIFFCRHPENHTNRKLKQKLGPGYVVLAQSSHIRWSNLIPPELLHNSFFFPHTAKNYLLIFNASNVMTFLCHLCWHNLQTNSLRLFSKVGPPWMMTVNYQRFLLSLGYNYLY